MSISKDLKPGTHDPYNIRIGQECKDNQFSDVFWHPSTYSQIRQNPLSKSRESRFDALRGEQSVAKNKRQALNWEQNYVTFST